MIDVRSCGFGGARHLQERGSREGGFMLNRDAHWGWRLVRLMSRGCVVRQTSFEAAKVMGTRSRGVKVLQC